MATGGKCWNDGENNSDDNSISRQRTAQQQRAGRTWSSPLGRGTARELQSNLSSFHPPLNSLLQQSAVISRAVIHTRRAVIHTRCTGYLLDTHVHARHLCLKKLLPTLLRSHRRQTQNTRSTLLYTMYIFFLLGLVGQLQIQLKILTSSSKGTQNCKKINCFYRRPHFWSGLLINYQSLDGV